MVKNIPPPPFGQTPDLCLKQPTGAPSCAVCSRLEPPRRSCSGGSASGTRCFAGPAGPAGGAGHNPGEKRGGRPHQHRPPHAGSPRAISCSSGVSAFRLHRRGFWIDQSIACSASQLRASEGARPPRVHPPSSAPPWRSCKAHHPIGQRINRTSPAAVTQLGFQDPRH